MRSLIFVILAALGFASVAQAADMPVPRPPAVAVAPPPAPAVCDDVCDVFKNTHNQKVGRCVDCVSIPLKQGHQGNVVLTLFDKSEQQLPNVYVNKKGTIDAARVERADLEAARGGHVVICNDVDTKTLSAKDVDTLLDTGMPPNQWVYLLAGRFHG